MIQPSSSGEFHELFSSLGFVPGVVRGARSFKVSPDGHLTGLVYPQVWTTGENVATCRAGQSGVAPYLPSAPAKADLTEHRLLECKCGFHAYYDGSNDYYRAEHVAGVIEGYGQTVIGTRGFRSTKTRLLALCVPRDIASAVYPRGGPIHYRLQHEVLELVSAMYPGVPLLPTFEDMVTEFPPDSGRE